MTARAKFLFDADFGRVKEAPPQITPDQHQAAVAAAELRGYERGVASAEAQARSEAERRAAAAYERIGGALAGLAVTMKEIEGRLEAEAVAVAGRLASALIAREPMA